MNRFLGLDYSSTHCAWACLDENGQLLSYGDFTFEDISDKIPNRIGAILNKVRRETINIISKLQPTHLFIEDIYAQTITGYKTLSKIQGVVEAVCYSYPEIEIMYRNALEVRGFYKLILTKKPFVAKYGDANIAKKIITKYFRIAAAKLKPQKKFKLDRYRRIWKRIKKSLKHYLIKEFDYYKKKIVIDYVNKKYNLKLEYDDNDTSDALVNATWLYDYSRGIIPKKLKKKRKKKVVKEVE